MMGYGLWYCLASLSYDASQAETSHLHKCEFSKCLSSFKNNTSKKLLVIILHLSDILQTFRKPGETGKDVPHGLGSYVRQVPNDRDPSAVEIKSMEERWLSQVFLFHLAEIIIVMWMKKATYFSIEVYYPARLAWSLLLRVQSISECLFSPKTKALRWAREDLSQKPFQPHLETPHFHISFCSTRATTPEIRSNNTLTRLLQLSTKSIIILPTSTYLSAIVLKSSKFLCFLFTAREKNPATARC